MGGCFNELLRRVMMFDHHALNDAFELSQPGGAVGAEPNVQRGFCVRLPFRQVREPDLKLFASLVHVSE